MTEREIAKDYVRDQLRSNKEFRVRLSELYIGTPTDVDPDYLLAAIKVEWPNMDDGAKLHLAQAIAGAKHYSAFLQAMDE